MRRNIEEILASQRAMLQRLDRKSDNVSDEEMAKKAENHLRKLGGWLATQSNIEVIHINYNEVIRNPDENAELISRFLGGRLNVDKMVRVVEKSLYRQRKKSVQSFSE